MQVELKELELTNYRNISHAHYKFDGNSKIVGENRIGKTNTLEAIVWLLTDKLLNGSSDIAQIKPLDDTKAEVRVWAKFNVNGQDITLRKEYGEDWVKTKGTDEYTFKGHYLTYYYNDVKQKTQRDFYALFNEDFGIVGDYKGIDLTQMLVDPFYLGNMGESDKWKDLRTFIISIIGDVNDDDVFAKNPTLEPLHNDLRVRMGRVEEVKKYYSNEIKGLQEQLIGVEAQIKMLEETDCPTDQELAVSKKAIRELDEDIAKLQDKRTSDAAVVELDKQINNLKSKQLDLIREQRNNRPENILNTQLMQANEHYRDLLAEKATNREKVIGKKHDAETTKNLIQVNIDKRATIISKLREIDGKLAQPFNAECPVCHRPLEGEELEKAIKEHNANLIAQKDSLMNEGKDNKRMKETNELLLSNLEYDVQELDKDFERIEDEIRQTLKDMEEINSKLNDAKTSTVDSVPFIDVIEEEIKSLEEKRDVLKTDNATSNVIINEQIEEKVQSKESYQKVVDDYNYYIRQMEQLVSIKAVRKDLKSSLANNEQKKELLNLFIKTKLEMLDENVKKVFGNIKFQLIKENINGGYDPVCKPYIYDITKGESTNVSWKSGSKSERVITGIAICEAIKSQLGLADLPFMFDEGGEISNETFNTKFITNSQLICVKVVDNITNPMVMKI